VKRNCMHCNFCIPLSHAQKGK